MKIKTVINVEKECATKQGSKRIFEQNTAKKKQSPTENQTQLLRGLKTLIKEEQNTKEDKHIGRRQINNSL
jgi:hypothetical protein